MIGRLWRRGWFQVLVVALASGLATACVAIAVRPAPDPAADGGEAAPRPVPPPAQATRGTASAAATTKLLRRRFSVFRAAGGPQDRVEVGRGRRSGDVDAGFVRENGLQVARGRLVRASPRVFAIPARGSVCLIYQQGGGECAPAATADRNFQVHTCGTVPPGRFELTGLVADSTRSVMLVLADRTRVALPVRRNFVRIVRRLSRPGQVPVRVELSGREGASRERVPSLTPREVACEGRQ